MAKLKCPILEIEEVIHPRKEEAFTRALSRYLCADMINEIIKIARPLTFKIFREERHFQKALKDSVESGTRSRCSFVSPLSEAGFIGRDGDVLLGIYSKGLPKIYLDGYDVKIRLIKTETVTSLGTFYAFPVPLLSVNLTYCRLKCQEVEQTLWFFEFDGIVPEMHAIGYFPLIFEWQ